MVGLLALCGALSLADGSRPVIEGDRLVVTDRERLFDLDFYRDLGGLTASYDVHPEGFVLAVDETDSDGKIVVCYWIKTVNQDEPNYIAATLWDTAGSP